MADGTLIVGVVGIVTSGIVAPLVAHHTQKERDVLGRQAEAIDTALAAMASARASQTWLEQRVLRDWRGGVLGGDLFASIRELFDQTHRLQSEAVRLQVHLGEGPLVARYVEGSNAIAQQSSALWRCARGEMSNANATRSGQRAGGRVAERVGRHPAPCSTLESGLGWRLARLVCPVLSTGSI